MSERPTHAKFGLGANAVQMMMIPSGLIDPLGRIKSNLSLDTDGIRIDAPAELFPFLKPNIQCIVTLSIVQVTPEEQLPPKPKLLGLND